jgi:hypothetical protein
MVIRTLGSPTMPTKLFGYFQCHTVVYTLISVLIDYFMGYVRARSLKIAA